MRDPTPEARTFTEADWKALYFAYRLVEQVALHGAPALKTFLAAAKEFPARTTHTED